MSVPTPWQMMVLLAGIGRVRDEHRAWLTGVLARTSEPKVRLLLALPNALMLLAAAGLWLVLFGDAIGGLIFLGAAALVLVVALLVPPIARGRARRLAARNSIPPPG
jgi:hypothetical protein